MAVIRRFLSYMPSHNGELPPVAPVSEGSGEDQEQILDDPARRSARRFTT